jgi:cytoskeleton protein RodZ
VSAETIENTAAGGSGVGIRLAAARVARSLSVADIARQLKFSPWQVEALEAGRYDRLPSAVFTRGFIRNYARLVGLDPMPLLIEADPHLPHNTRSTPGLPPSTDIRFPTGRPIKWYRYAAVTLLLVVSVATFEIFREDDSPEAKVKPSVAAVPLPAAAVLPVPAVAAAAAGVAAPAVQVAAVPSAHVKIEPAAAEHSLTFTFVQDSWVEVHDGHGRRLLWQLNAAGTQQKVSGPPPLSLVIGNAGGVRLQINNKLFDLNPYVDVDVARLVLD